MFVARSAALFAIAAVFEIGGCRLVWQGVRKHRDWWWTIAGIALLGGYGFVAARQPSGDFGRILAAYGGIFVAGSLLWGWGFDGYRPDRFDILGGAICLIGMTVIMFAPRGR
jgi:small multidrug resistance family-3 protein